MPEEQKDDEMITLAQATRDYGIPLSTLHSARKDERLWAEPRQEARGIVWYTTRSEIARFKRTYRQHKDIKNS